MQDVRTTIVIVDDDEMARRGLCALLHAQADLHVIADCATVRDAVARVVRFGPQVVVMEPALPDIDGCDPCGLVHEHAVAREAHLPPLLCIERVLQPHDRRRGDVSRHAEAGRHEPVRALLLRGVHLSHPQPSMVGGRVVPAAPLIVGGKREGRAPALLRRQRLEQPGGCLGHP